MNPEITSSVIKRTPRESVVWFETVGLHPEPHDSTLGSALEIMALSACVSELALTCDQPGVPHATDGSVKSVMPALVSHRVGIRPEEAFEGRFTDALLIEPPDVLRAAKSSMSLIETPVEEPPSAASADH